MFAAAERQLEMISARLLMLCINESTETMKGAGA